jgi:hypothetical protein
MQIVGLQTSIVGKANTAFALGYFPRVKDQFYKKVSRSVKSTRSVEPFALNGAGPLLRQWKGKVSSAGRNSWAINVPNPLYKSFEEINRGDLEKDQTGSVVASMFQVGMRGAQTPDYVLARKWLTADQSSSTSELYYDDGIIYPTVFETGTPLFANTHTGVNGTFTQSNIVQGGLPTTTASYLANDVGTNSQIMLRDISRAINQVMQWTDDRGAILYPNFDPAKDLMIVTPPLLAPAAKLAFSLPGIIGGTTSGGNNGSTTNIGPMFVNQCEAWSLLAGVPDITQEDETVTVSPQFPTQYYGIINNDYISPFYYQYFVRPSSADMVGGSVEAEARSIMQSASEVGLPIDQVSAQVFASFEVNTNIGSLGTMGQRDIAVTEKFFVEGRTRCNFVYGTWFTIFKIDPTGQST